MHDWAQTDTDTVNAQLCIRLLGLCCWSWTDVQHRAKGIPRENLFFTEPRQKHVEFFRRGKCGHIYVFVVLILFWIVSFCLFLCSTNRHARGCQIKNNTYYNQFIFENAIEHMTYLITLFGLQKSHLICLEMFVAYVQLVHHVGF